MRNLGLQSAGRLLHGLDLGQYLRQVCLQHLAAAGDGGIPCGTKFCKRQHLLNGHLGGSQSQQELDPSQIRRGIPALPTGGAGHRRNQPDALVIAQGMGRQTGAACHLVNA